ncbi:MAG: hypothetical protein ACRBDI_07730 [Alphaproteobacteria bacterium]
MKSKLLLIMCVPFALNACASVDAAKDEKGLGLTKTYNVGFDTAWTASTAAIQDTGGKVVETSKETGTILASYGVSAFSWGERVGVYLNTVNENSTQIEVASKRAVGMNVTATDWEPKIHAKIGENLEGR